ncbi:hypothetical protein C8J56DRAFT_1059310 [Mycena floridula]|nr:hypothetical protein C8J56DRAFT_1059310 [Mycena floridula]
MTTRRTVIIENIETSSSLGKLVDLCEAMKSAVAVRDSRRGKEYAKKHRFRQSYGGQNSYQDLIGDPEIDVIYNASPNGLHFGWNIKALDGGKYVLLEKPATNTAHEAEKIFALAEEKGLVVLEAFHYRCGNKSAFQGYLDSKELGEIRVISSSLTAPAGIAPEGDIRWSYEFGGGSTMDPVCYYAVNSILRHLASSNPKSVLSASAVRYSARPGHERVDKSFNATLPLSFEKDIATVECEGGTIEINNCLVPPFITR